MNQETDEGRQPPGAKASSPLGRAPKPARTLKASAKDRKKTIVIAPPTPLGPGDRLEEENPFGQGAVDDRSLPQRGRASTIGPRSPSKRPLVASRLSLSKPSDPRGDNAQAATPSPSTGHTLPARMG